MENCLVLCITYPSKSKICKFSNTPHELISDISLYAKYSSLKLGMVDTLSMSSNPHRDIHSILREFRQVPKSLKKKREINELIISERKLTYSKQHMHNTLRTSHTSSALTHMANICSKNYMYAIFLLSMWWLISYSRSLNNVTVTHWSEGFVM